MHKKVNNTTLTPNPGAQEAFFDAPIPRQTHRLYGSPDDVVNLTKVPVISNDSSIYFEHNKNKVCMCSYCTSVREESKRLANLADQMVIDKIIRGNIEHD